MEIHTKNLVESWHNTLKNVYLKGARKKRTDILLYTLAEEMLQVIRRIIAFTLNDFQRRRTSLAEQRQLDESVAIPDEIALKLASRSFNCKETEVSTEEMYVRSFSEENVKYSISLIEDSLIARYLCLYLDNNMCNQLNNIYTGIP